MNASESLASIYRSIPITNCERCLDCCRVSPPVAYVEMLQLDLIVRRLEPCARLHFFHAVIRTELLGRLLTIGTCPFLVNRACSIYRDRPFACRQFGLTSPDEYTKITKRELAQYDKDKNELLAPTFQERKPPSYCHRIWLEPDHGNKPDDEMLRSAGRRIAELETDGRAERHAVSCVSYALGILLRLWGSDETRERLKYLSGVFIDKGLGSAEEISERWAADLDRSFVQRFDK